jgi:hypothetical protein
LIRSRAKRRFAEIDKSTFSAEPSAPPVLIAPAETLQTDAAWKILAQIDEKMQTPEQYNARQIAAHTHRLVQFQLDQPRPQKRRPLKKARAYQVDSLEQLTAAAEHFGPASACAKLLVFVSSFEDIHLDLFHKEPTIDPGHSFCCPTEPAKKQGLCKLHWKTYWNLLRRARRECEK